jgi:hypothetical protein
VRGGWGRSDIPYVFLLFNDILVYGSTQPTGQVLHHRTMVLLSIAVTDIPDSER